MSLPSPPTTSIFNKNFLSRARRYGEISFSLTRYKLSYDIPPIKLNNSAPNHFPLNHLQDLSNKCTIIYGLSSSPLPEHTFIYNNWTRGNPHATDIDFGRYFHKFVPVEANGVGLGGRVAEIVRFHLGVCGRFEEWEREFCLDRSQPRGNTTNRSVQINKKQPSFFKIKPLCRALIIITLEPTSAKRDGSTQVLLVRTGVEKGLSSPINFIGLQGSYLIEDFEDQPFGDEYVVFSTTMAEAFQFIVNLDEREEAASPENKDFGVMDDLGMGMGGSFALLGQEANVPSTSWITQQPECRDAISSGHVSYLCKCWLHEQGSVAPIASSGSL